MAYLLLLNRLLTELYGKNERSHQSVHGLLTVDLPCNIHEIYSVFQLEVKRIFGSIPCVSVKNCVYLLFRKFIYIIKYRTLQIPQSIMFG